MLSIQESGSFQPRLQNHFSALFTGHASAVMLAINWLQMVALPAAIKQDLELQAQGHVPKFGFLVNLSETRPLPACPNCGQCDVGQTGEYNCPICGLPTVWDEKVPKGI